MIYKFKFSLLWIKIEFTFRIADGYKMVKFYPENDSKEMNELLSSKFNDSENWIQFLLHMNGGFGIRNSQGELVACISRNEFFSEGFVDKI